MRYFTYMLAGVFLSALAAREAPFVGAVGFIAVGVLILYFRRQVAAESAERFESVPAFPRSIHTSIIAALKFKSFQSYALFSTTAAGVLSIVAGIVIFVVR